MFGCCAALAGAALSAWCASAHEDASTPAGRVAAYAEAPMLAERVAAGDLPPVHERLPENPLVVEPVESIGQYGGTWRRFSLGTRDLLLTSRMGYEPLVRWDSTGRNVAPGLAERWEVLDDGRTYVFHLRKGLRWSDGHPFTSEDYRFYFDDVLTNTELTPSYPIWLVVGGERVRFEAPDPHTLVFRFAQPYSIFPEMLAYYSLTMPAPKHYLMHYMPKYRNEEELVREARTRGMDLWYQLYARKADHNTNPDLPTWRPYRITEEPPRSRMIVERNPYYWKVDPAGNQLPYIDRIAFLDVQNNQVVTMKAMAGETDFQARRIDTADYPLFMQERQKGGYRVLRDTSPGAVVLYLNQHSKDPVLRGVLQDRRFRIALSISINRAELVDLIYSGMATPSRGIASPYDPYYLPEFEEMYLEYDPERANALLDEVGLPRGRDGLRRLPDGSAFRQIIHVYPSESGTSNDLWQLVADYFREVGLDFIVKIDAVTLSVMQARNGNSDFFAYLTSGLHWVVDPQWYVPWMSTSYFAPLYGRYTFSSGRDAMGVKPPEEYQRLVDWYRELCSVHGPDEQERKLELGRKILGQWAEECYTIGICRTDLLTIAKNNFRNVPDTIIHDYRVFTPGYMGIEQFYFDTRE